MWLRSLDSGLAFARLFPRCRYYRLLASPRQLLVSNPSYHRSKWVFSARGIGRPPRTPRRLLACITARRRRACSQANPDMSMEVCGRGTRVLRLASGLRRLGLISSPWRSWELLGWASTWLIRRRVVAFLLLSGTARLSTLSLRTLFAMRLCLSGLLLLWLSSFRLQSSLSARSGFARSGMSTMRRLGCCTR